MRNLLYALMIALVSMTSCESDFNIAADWKEIPIIIGLLDIQDTVHYISITKAFLDEDQDALFMAQQADSLYFPDELLVEIEEYNDSSLVETKTLTRLNGNDVGIVRDEGVFVDAPNVLYAYEKRLNSANMYKLKVENTTTGRTATAETRIIDDFEFFVTTTPSNQAPFQVVNFISNTARFIEYELPRYAKFYDFNMLFNFRESNIDNLQDYVDTSIILTFEDNTEIPNSNPVFLDDKRLFVSQDDFFDWILAQVKENNSVTRCPGYLEFNFAFGDSIFRQYFLINNANQGLTEGQASAVYTNITGGLGLFASRQLKSISLADIYEFAEQDGIELSEQTLDSLSTSLLTNHLNFIDSRPCVD